MSEQMPSPEIVQPPTREEVTSALQRLAQRLVPQGFTNPDDLLGDLASDPEVAAAQALLNNWWTNLERHAKANPDPAAAVDASISRSIIYIDGGFTDPDFIDEVANDWLIQDLDRAEADGQVELAARIQAKIDELTAMITPHNP